MKPSASDLLAEKLSVEHVAEAAGRTFGTPEKARRWLDRPTTALGGRSPMGLAASGRDGAREVLDLLARIDHGLAV